MDTSAYEQAPLLGGGNSIDAAMLSPPHGNTLPLSLLSHPSLQLTALSLALMLALQTTAPVAAAWAALAVSLISAFFSLTTHVASGGSGGSGPASGPRARDRPAPPPKTGPSTLASLALDAAGSIAAASWLACWAWADPLGQKFWLRWMPTLVLALFAAQLIVAALIGYPTARALLLDKTPPLALSMSLPARPVAGNRASPAWFAALSRDVTLAWGLMAALAAASCAVPAAMDWHSYAGSGSDGGAGHGGGGAGSVAADGLDVALSVCVPFALGLAALALGEALCERARRARLRQLMLVATSAQAPSSLGGGLQQLQQQQQAEVTAPPSGVAGLV